MKDAVTTDRGRVRGGAGRRRPRACGRDATRRDLAEQTKVGEALVRGLVRAQLALALRLALVVAIGLGGLPLLFAVAPAVTDVKVAGVNLPWLLLGVAAYPFLIVVGWAYVCLAERNEQDFTAVVQRSGSVPDFRLSAVLAGAVPILLALNVSGLDVSHVVGLAFARRRLELLPAADAARVRGDGGGFPGDPAARSGGGRCHGAAPARPRRPAPVTNPSSQRR